MYMVELNTKIEECRLWSQDVRAIELFLFFTPCMHKHMFLDSKHKREKPENFILVLKCCFSHKKDNRMTNRFRV